MMIEKSGTIRLRDIPTAAGLSPKEQELAAGMVRVTHLYRSALKVAVTQMEILDEEFARLYDHSPIHHIEYRIKTLDSIIDKLRRRGLEVSIDNIYAHIQDVAGIRVICNYLDDIYYLRSLLTRSESYTVLREVDYIKEPKDTGYRSLHLIVNVPIVISEGTMVLPVEIQLRTIAMDMWASLEHELRYKSDRKFTQQDAARCGHRKAKRGAEIPHHNHHGVGRHSVIAQMPQNNGVHGKRHTPGHIIAQRRQRQPDEITPQQFIGMEHFP